MKLYFFLGVVTVCWDTATSKTISLFKLKITVYQK